jgi:FAD/FMN-containing dehydrogenase
MSLIKTQESTGITNFGGNISFVPKYRYKPQNEAEVLDLLKNHANSKIRVVASLHSWSDVVQSEDVIVDMGNFDSVAICASHRSAHAEVSASLSHKRRLARCA